MSHVYSELASRGDGKSYVYIPEFQFGWFVPRKLKNAIRGSLSLYNEVREKMESDPGYFGMIERELSVYKSIQGRLDSRNGRGM
jgi:hypothetical protein